MSKEVKKRCKKHDWRSWDGINKTCVNCHKTESIIKTKKEWDQFQDEIDSGLHQ